MTLFMSFAFFLFIVNLQYFSLSLQNLFVNFYGKSFVKTCSLHIFPLNEKCARRNRFHKQKRKQLQFLWYNTKIAQKILLHKNMLMI